MGALTMVLCRVRAGVRAHAGRVAQLLAVAAHAAALLPAARARLLQRAHDARGALDRRHLQQPDLSAL